MPESVQSKYETATGTRVRVLDSPLLAGFNSARPKRFISVCLDALCLNAFCFSEPVSGLHITSRLPVIPVATLGSFWKGRAVVMTQRCPKAAPARPSVRTGSPALKNGAQLTRLARLRLPRGNPAWSICLLLLNRLDHVVSVPVLRGLTAQP